MLQARSTHAPVTLSHRPFMTGSSHLRIASLHCGSLEHCRELIRSVAVPELTRSVNIKLNKRVWLPRHVGRATVVSPDDFPGPGLRRDRAVERSYLTALFRRIGSNRVSSKKSAPLKPKDILGKSADEPLWARYQELIRLRREVQDAASAAAQSSKKGEIGDDSR